MNRIPGAIGFLFRGGSKNRYCESVFCSLIISLPLSETKSEHFSVKMDNFIIFMTKTCIQKYNLIKTTERCGKNLVELRQQAFHSGPLVKDSI